MVGELEGRTEEEVLVLVLVLLVLLLDATVEVEAAGELAGAARRVKENVEPTP